MHPLRIGIAVLALFAVACAGKSATQLSEAARSEGAVFWVENHGRDNRNLEEIIANALRLRGLEASGGQQNARPADFDFLVTYVDRWSWDMRTFLMKITINVEDASSGQIVATSESHQDSLTAMGKSYEDIVTTTTFLLLDGVH